MAERACTEWLVAELRARVPGVIPIKHADGFTSGIPDLTVSFRNGGGTTWVEVKEVGANGVVKPTVKDFAALQWDYVNSLSNCGPAYYAIFTEESKKKNRRMLVAHPTALRIVIDLKRSMRVKDGDLSHDVEHLIALLRNRETVGNWELIE